jgi:undecaprenyl-phosphate 4-deoxy-4-formamido-L-arabinose transferase
MMSAPPATPQVSVVVPVYGGEKTIERLVDATIGVLDEAGLTHEIILVCDRPRDQSWKVAQALAARAPAVRAYLFMRNFGQHPATLFGIRKARGEVIVTMDEDLQHDPIHIPELIRVSRECRGIAYGAAHEWRHAWWRNVTSRLAKWFLARYIGFDMARSATSFRAFPARLREAFGDYRGERVAIDVLLSWSGAPIRTVRFEHAERAEGHSGYTLRKLVGYLMDLLVGYTVAPLRLASLLGLLAVIFALAVGGYALANWAMNGSAVPGFAFLAMTASILGGAQLLALGVIGEYLGRLYFNSLGKPQYLVQDVVGDEEPRDGKA